MESLIAIAIAVAVVVAVALVMAGKRYEFCVRIRDSTPSIAHGKVGGAFVQDLADVLGEFSVISGWVGGVRHGRLLKLEFSRSIPEPCRQRLRNLWNSHRW